MEKNEKFSHGIEIILESPDDFLKIKETLTRIGVKSKKENILVQSAHILHKRGRYYILHFKELFILDKKTADFSDDDFRRRNTIAKLISQWGMCKILYSSDIELTTSVSEISILPYKEKNNWQLVSKYSVGKKPKKD